MYYGIILIAVLMFGGGFALNDIYQKMRGSSLKTSFQFTFVCSLAGLVILLALNGFRFEFTPFTLCMALLSALSGLAFNFCAFISLWSDKKPSKRELWSVVLAFMGMLALFLIPG